jgi:3-deoxy-7-phosphoheptulonate synthase / chorismate mutase
LSDESDPTIRDLRAQVSAADRAVLEAVNRRLELVAELKRYKESRGLAFVDPERERVMLEELARANGGPLSDEGVRELLTMLLDLTKREV